MGRRRERNELSLNNNEDEKPSLEKEQMPTPPLKKQKTLLQEEESVPKSESSQTLQIERPKSRKELRTERKKARQLAADPESAVALLEVEQRRLKKEQEREEFRQIIKDERNMQKARQQKKLNRVTNAPGGHADSSVEKKSRPTTSETKKASNKNITKKKESSPPKTIEEDDVARKVMNEIKYGTSDTSGWTTLQLGVKHKDIVVGTGNLVQNKSLVTVKYQLKGGKFGVVLDSSKKFNFRVGKAEVIQGWDIGVMGMQEGGRRRLVVPPKAGYGAKDIGAGPGGLLHFDITVLEVRV
jgi:FK506-binding nuclear protein